MLPCSVSQIEATGRQRQAEILDEAERMRRSLDAGRIDRAPAAESSIVARFGRAMRQASLAGGVIRLLTRPANVVGS